VVIAHAGNGVVLLRIFGADAGNTVVIASRTFTYLHSYQGENTIAFNENNCEKCLICYLKLKILSRKNVKNIMTYVLKKRNVFSWNLRKINKRETTAE